MASQARQILLVEDDDAHALLMRETLSSLSCDVEHVPTRASALRALSERAYDLVVLDLGLPDGDGRDIQRWLTGRDSAPPIVFVTSDDQAETAVEAIRAGASHYVVKRPHYLARMADAVSEALSGTRQVGQLPERARQPDERELVGSSPSMARLRRRIREYGPSDSAVLVSGETGTGKELVARGLHRASRRAAGPFVAVNCAAISSDLFDSEVFGSLRGAFTGSVRDREGLVGAARGGTLFLDEVGELSVAVQAKLLRFIEDGSYRVVGESRERRADLRVITATNRNLGLATQSGEFRRDLYYRLTVLRIHVPPLREHREDVPELVAHMLSRRGERVDVPAQAIAELMAQAWPGNVRELEHTIERTLVRARGRTIRRFDLESDLEALAAPSAPGSGEREQLIALLARHRGALTPVAREFGASVRTVQRRMSELNLRARDFRDPSP